ncbi:MAG: hypothetical protein U1E81_02875 [Xanthobacteraceae bacterium]
MGGKLDELPTDDDSIYARDVLTAAKQAYASCDSDPQRYCRALKGAFPAVVAGSLQALINHERMFSNRAAWQYIRQRSAPEPHPIDFDWRFTRATSNSLADLACAQGSVLCVGTPSVFEAIAARGGEALLLDRNPLLKFPKNSACRYTVTDLREKEELRGEFDAAVLDPPWYPEHYRTWIARALTLLARPGVIYLALFRELTRPGASGDRDFVLSLLEALGNVSFLREHELIYSTPPFEAEVLAHLNLPVLPTWRVADLVRVDVKDPHSICLDKDGYASEAPFDRFAVGDQVVVVRHPVNDTGPISYYNPGLGCDGFMLNSVSNRNPSRSDITVWTSRNRAAVATGTRRIAALLSRMTGNIQGKPSVKNVSEDDEITFNNLLGDLKLNAGTA